MSIINYSTVELSDVVKESNLIVEVEYLMPFSEEIIVKGINNTLPFIKKGFEFKILNVLKNSGKIALPLTIQVPNENWRRSLSEYKNEHGDGPGKSYEVKQYETEITTIKNAGILFLHQFKNTFELEMKDSFESIEAREKVTMLVASE
jgi:hypothetical protein